jgi:hypothetical protein
MKMRSIGNRESWTIVLAALIVCGFLAIAGSETLNAETLTFCTTEDVHIYLKHPDDNYSRLDWTAVANRCGHPSDPLYWQFNPMVKFDLSSISARTTVISATLHLYYYAYWDTNPAGRDLTCCRITSDWNEQTVTWNTQPTYVSEPTYSSVVPSTKGWMVWDVTSDVQAFVGGNRSITAGRSWTQPTGGITTFQ